MHAQLHQRDDRSAQRCDAEPPGSGLQCIGLHHAPGSVLPGRLPSYIADVSRQRLGRNLGSDGRGGHAHLPAQGRCVRDLRADPKIQGYLRLRGAYRAGEHRQREGGCARRSCGIANRHSRRPASGGGDRAHGRTGRQGHARVWAHRDRPFPDDLRVEAGV